MRVTATVTIGTIETRIRGECPFLDGKLGDSLARKELGVWLTDYRINGQRGRTQRGRVFIPWTTCLYLEENKENGGKSGTHT